MCSSCTVHYVIERYVMERYVMERYWNEHQHCSTVEDTPKFVHFPRPSFFRFLRYFKEAQRANIPTILCVHKLRGDLKMADGKQYTLLYISEVI